ncbi:hypothetical protein GL270_21815 [Aeromonas veronii]|uniref:hypothetical protein n=1 Tax=Aeromonas veronii TaxID=654 RepID=UPI001C5BB29E|nr:hypothetical protein [Aeromonas veronii]MBW3783835.1 hypothetical protein [Aeromonas veronii]
MAGSYLFGDGKKVIIDMITKIPALIFIGTTSLLPWISEREFAVADYIASAMLSTFSLYCVIAVFHTSLKSVTDDLGKESNTYMAQLGDMGVKLTPQQYCKYLFKTQKMKIIEGAAVLIMIPCAIGYIEYGVLKQIQDIYEQRHKADTYQPEFHSCPIPPVELTMEPSPPVSCNE